ncbi:ATP-dependent DNA helicase [Kiritimatiellaeota bacterium B1221]|nr:ATP-dependent DNA helicase [Kiritimatiellaeota bacterium B1221]
MHIRRISVTEFSRQMGRSGDLGRRHFSLLRGVEGIQVHQRMQKNRGEEYEAEVSIQSTWELAGESVEIFGRIDGVERSLQGVVIEEFKTSRDYEDRLPLDHSVHVLQAELYAWMWFRERGTLPSIRLEYVHPDPQIETRRIEWQPEAEALSEKVEGLLGQWMQQKLAQEAWIRERNERLENLCFPFAEMRPGQQELIDQVKSSVSDGGRLYVQAPTGIGKTMGVLLPALQAMGRGRFSTLMIATCRNTGKRIFEEAMGHLFPEKPGLRVLTLVAKERGCKETGSPCDCENCPLAVGFYDRLPEAMVALRTEKTWDAETWQAVAGKFQLCPFALMMQTAREADVILGDLNYALDPAARLEFLFGENPESVCLLIDEAHHLPDRSRSMISAALEPRYLQTQFRALPAEIQAVLNPSFQKVLRELRAYCKSQLDREGWPKAEAEMPEGLSKACNRALEMLEASFADLPGQPADPRLELYRSFAGFRQSMEHRQDSHVCTFEDGVFQHLCLNAAEWLKERFASLASTVVFSGTLLPLDLFMRLTGAEAESQKLALPSPFSAAKFRIELEEEIPLVWKARGPELYERLAQRIVTELTARSVKTLVFFPSYALMDEVAARLPKHDLWLGPIYQQPKGLQEEGADAFLKPFRESEGPVCGLAVLGGALNEGIDLPGRALESVIVVSIGLPGLSRERELMRRWFEARGEEGFVMAYTYPGLVRVLQAMGRVIRGPEDQGTALLIDPRYKHPLYREYICFK